MTRYAILVEGEFNYLYAKTAIAILRYRPEEVGCMIDSETAGSTSQEVIGVGGDIPVVATLQDALQYDPDTLLVGIANPGGVLPKSWRKTISEAIESQLDIICGLHFFLSDDPEFSSLAREYGVTLTDLRRPPKPLPFTKGSWQKRKVPVLATVGTDCDTGKMTAAWELKNLLEDRGKNVAFVGTGQTGILLGGSGVAVDAVVSDFAAGVIEAEIDKVTDHSDLVIVEGQGGITHMAYSGVTLGLLHGSMPDLLLLCHEEGREMDTFDWPMAPFETIMELYLKLVRVFKPCEICGISLLTHHIGEQEARTALKRYEEKYRLPAADFIRFGGDNIADRVVAQLSSFGL